MKILDLVAKVAIIKKQGTSGLPEVHDNIDGTQSCMCCKATHAAEKVSSWLQSTADCGKGRMSQLFRFFLYFLDLGFSQEFIASDLKRILEVKTDPKPDPNPDPGWKFFEVE